jgi:hypothetical protein
VHFVSPPDASSPAGLVVSAGQAWQLFPSTRSFVAHVTAAHAVFTPAAGLSPAGRLFPAGQSKHVKMLPPTTEVSTYESAAQVHTVLSLVASSPTPSTNGLTVSAGQATQMWLSMYSSSAHTAGLQQVPTSQAQPVPSQLMPAPLLRLASLQPAKLSQVGGVQSCVQVAFAFVVVMPVYPTSQTHR